MGRSSVRAEREEKQSIRERFNRFLSMVIEKGRTSSWNIDATVMEELQDLGQRARDQRSDLESVPEKIGIEQRDISPQAMEAGLDLALALEQRDGGGIMDWVRQ